MSPWTSTRSGNHPDDAKGDTEFIAGSPASFASDLHRPHLSDDPIANTDHRILEVDRDTDVRDDELELASDLG